TLGDQLLEAVPAGLLLCGALPALHLAVRAHRAEPTVPRMRAAAARGRRHAARAHVGAPASGRWCAGPRTRAGAARAGLLETDVDLGDLEFARGAARHLDRDGLVAFAAEQGTADRRLVGELVFEGLGLGRADDRVLDRLARLLVLDVD